jgi:hypothetical protein
MGPSGAMRAPDRAPPDDVAGRGRLFGAFAAVLAIALVLDQLWWGGFEVASPRALVVAAAVVVLWRPRSVGAFAAMLGAEVVAVARDMPVVGTHRVLLLVVAGTSLAWLGWSTLRERRAPGPGEAFAALAPFLRVALVVTYAFAALAKLNSAFVDPATSCATPLTLGLLGPGAPVALAPAGTVVVEIALAVLLAIPRTRPAGVLLGLGFHAVLAVAGNVPFAGVALALLVAFLPDAARRRLRIPRWWRGAVPALLVGVWIVGAVVGPSQDAPGLSGVPSAAVSPTVRLLAQLTVLVLAGAGVVLVVATRGAPLARARSRLTPILAAGAAVLVLNGLAPYLGLKTDTAFEMFSGLRTEPGAWNSLVVPEAVRVFGYQDRAVTVLPTGTRLLRFEVERFLRTRPGSVATVLDGAVPSTLGPLPPGPTLAERVALFRPLVPPGVPRC